MTTRVVCLVGFGEVGQALAADLRASGAGAVSAWDIKFSDAESAPSRGLRDAGVRAGYGLADALNGASVVISAVTAAECIEVAREVAPALAPDAFYLDLNSVSPHSKAEAAEAVIARGGRYVEAAVMAPIAPLGIASPILLGGPHAAAFHPHARQLGFAGAKVFSNALGRASAAKMCRSVMIKGVEALLTESLLAARHYQVEDAVLDSLHDLLPASDWRSLSRYMIARSLQHGARRAEEMREVARTVADAGVAPWMSRACVERQSWAGAHGHAISDASLDEMLDAVLARSPEPPGAS